MRIIMLSGGGECDSNELGTLFGTDVELVFLTNLSELERMTLTACDDVLLLFTKALTCKIVAFVDRLMTFSAIPLLVNAQDWQLADLKCLLECGRVTFVPGQLEITRLQSVIELAKLRFEGAGIQLSKISSLESALSGQKKMMKVKAKLQAEGLTEAQSHQLLQAQAMKKGISLERLVEQLA
ncbi:MAG: hypothetical protein ACI90A_001358 [Shewanella sp.]|jgi:hypothetical protein